MARLTAIEFASDGCTMAGTIVRGEAISLSAVERLDPASFPGADTFTAAIRQTRAMLKLPHRARVVLWGPDGAAVPAAASEPYLQSLKAAGFRIERVVSPCDALAALARIRRPRTDGAIAWIAINRGHVAMVVVRPGTLLYSTSFAWDSNMAASGSQAALLQRYLMVSFLAPEVRKAMAAAGEKGFRVDALVTCGDLPDLRSLTMPLIEELDVEVETLDSLEGLTVPAAIRDRVGELAPGLRIACAGLLARPARGPGLPPRRAVSAPVAAAAVIAIAGAAGWWWYSSGRASVANTPVTPARPAQTTVPAAPPAAAPRSTPPAQTTAAVRPAPQPTPSKSESQVARSTQPAAPPAPPPSQAKRPATAQPAATAPSRTPSPATPAPRRDTTPPPAPAQSRPATPVPPRAAAAPTRKNPPPASSELPTAAKPSLPATAGRADNPGAGSGPRLLPDPLPRVSTILTAQDRRLALVDGRMVHVGDSVGQRVVTAIDARSLVLREPSGVQIRVGLGGRFIGIERKR